MRASTPRTASSSILALVLGSATALSTVAFAAPAQADGYLSDAQAACGGSAFQPVTPPSEIGGGMVYLLFDGSWHCSSVVKTSGRGTASFMEADIQVHGQNPASYSGSYKYDVGIKADSPDANACVRYGGSIGDGMAADLLYPQGCWG
jgi:hypothetical protein